MEQTVVSTFKSKGFEVVKYRVWNKDKDKYGKELLLENVPFESIYGHKGNTEFLLKSEIHVLEIRIECKWQQSAGSVDEKFPYLYLNCIETMPEDDIIIIVDGGGYKLSREQSGHKEDNIIDLINYVSIANELEKKE